MNLCLTTQSDIEGIPKSKTPLEDYHKEKFEESVRSGSKSYKVKDVKMKRIKKVVYYETATLTSSSSVATSPPPTNVSINERQLTKIILKPLSIILEFLAI